MRRLDGKVAIVTGSGRGIGRAIALKLAAEGAAVVVNDLDDDTGRGVASEIEAHGGKASVCNGDVTEAEFADRMIARALTEFGGLDILINNAGYTWDNVIQKMSDPQFDAMLDVHLRAPFRLLRAAANPWREMAKREQASGRINYRKVVNISSINGIVGQAGQANYSAAKAGVIGLTKALAKEWGRYAINVNAVAFGAITTRLTQTLGSQSASIDIKGRAIPVGLHVSTVEKLQEAIPLGRPGTPEEAAGGVFLLCLPESDYITGQVLIVSGGQ